MPLLQTKPPAPVPIVHVALMRRAAPVMMQMSPPVQVVSSCGRTLMLSSKRSWPAVVLVNVPVMVAT